MEENGLQDFFSYLKRYIVFFVLAVVLAVGGVAVYDALIKKPVYQAYTNIVIAKSENTDNSTAALNDVNVSQKLTSTYSEIAKSELVLNKVIAELKLDIGVKELSGNVSVKPVDGTSILKISVNDLDPERAAVIANKIADVFTGEIMKIYKLDNVSQLSVAETPEQPANNTMMRDTVAAAMVAVMVVAGVVFLKYYLDDTVRHKDDVEKMLGVPMIGSVIKSASTKGQNGADELVVRDAPKSIVSENIKSLRTNLQFTAVDKNLKTILVTSTNAGEGKSFVSANLAVSFAQADKRVLLVDCDLRRGRIHRLFNIPNTEGLSNLLTDSLANAYRYVRGTGIPNLSVITCGAYPPNPSELLASQKNKNLIRGMYESYDIVIFDGAPVAGLADSVILANLMNETIIVTKDAETSKNDLAQTVSALNKVGAKVAGVVFNMVNQKSSKYYNYKYYYGESKKHD